MTVDAILDQLGSHHPRAERAAARRLVRAGARNRSAIEAALFGHRNAHARAVAAVVLSQIDPRRARRPLLRALMDPAMTVRLHALLALDRNAWGPGARAAVLRLLRDPSGGVRVNAIDVLARHRVRGATGPLTRCLRDEKPYVRLRAADVLARIGGGARVAR